MQRRILDTRKKIKNKYQKKKRKKNKKSKLKQLSSLVSDNGNLSLTYEHVSNFLEKEKL